MADIEPQQSGHLPGRSVPRFLAPQEHTYVSPNAGVSLECCDTLPLLNTHLSVHDVL